MRVVRDSLITLMATLGNQASAFLLLGLSAHLMPVNDFARVSIIVATVMLSSALADFGLSITATKIYGRTGKESVFNASLRFKLFLCIFVFIVLCFITGFYGLKDSVLGVFLGVLLSLWNGIRSADQARQDYKSFARGSFLFSIVRMTAGLLVIFLYPDPILLVFAMYGVPVVFIGSCGGLKYLRSADGEGWLLIRGAIRYSWFTYLNAIAFVALPYIPQFLAAIRLSSEDVAKYGLIMAFSGPIGLIVYSIRAALLPKFFQSGGKIERALWSLRGAGVLLFLYGVFIVVGCVLSVFLDVAYGAQYEGVGGLYFWYFAGYSLTAVIGILGLSVHTLEIPHVSFGFGVLKLAALLVVLYFFGFTLSVLVYSVVLVMLLGEVLQTLSVWNVWRKVRV